MAQITLHGAPFRIDAALEKLPDTVAVERGPRPRAVLTVPDEIFDEVLASLNQQGAPVRNAERTAMVVDVVPPAEV